MANIFRNGNQKKQKRKNQNLIYLKIYSIILSKNNLVINNRSLFVYENSKGSLFKINKNSKNSLFENDTKNNNILMQFYLLLGSNNNSLFGSKSNNNTLLWNKDIGNNELFSYINNNNQLLPFLSIYRQKK